MEVAISPSRFPILTLTLIGLLFVLANEALIRGLMSLAARSHQNVASIGRGGELDRAGAMAAGDLSLSFTDQWDCQNT